MESVAYGDGAQRGERYFNDAEYCFQNWQSCNGCHPGDGRTDGMNLGPCRTTV